MLKTIYYSLIMSLILSLTSCNINFEKQIPDGNRESDLRISPSKIVIEEDTYHQNPSQKHFAPSKIGYIVYDTNENQVLFSHNRKKLFMPASTAKLITVITSFIVLGDNYRFTTSLYYNGIIKDRTLHGDLYLKGEGDPSFTVSDMVSMIAQLRRKGITSINGTFYYDKSSLTSKTVLNNKFDEDESYNAGISALSCEYNYISVNWSTPNKDGVVEFNTTPDLPYFKMERSDKDLQKHEKFVHIYDNYRSKWQLSKSITKRGRHRLPVRNTALHTAYLFRKICDIHGIKLSYPKESIIPEDSRPIIQHKGKTVASIAKTTLEFSVNQSAELLFLNSARKIAKKPLSYSESSVIIANLLKKKFPKIDWTGFKIDNGSGLTTSSRMSPEQLLALLIYADSNRYDSKEFEYYLLPSGWGWSLRRRFNKPENEFTLYAKTGTINYATALAGLFYTKSGKRLLFVFFNTDNYLRELYDRDTKNREEKPQKDARIWHAAYLTAMDAMINDWIHNL
ncbi:MAG: D-alanyl-D-alanine carboxypeptidase/D-alanyl-D-alanine-endopeptidase [Spirochaetes bacterium]|nr:D-alanyl-D-alanine carboxypeptidase/D-alanyl-D-alanine-endopeptidase [Spirochaetota bacterium]